MATPINSVRTRVIELADGSYVAQLSTDGMMWADIYYAGNMDDAIDFAGDIAYRTSRIPLAGSVIWKSDAS